jgi:hypothetical protein
VGYAAYRYFRPDPDQDQESARFTAILRNYKAADGTVIAISEGEGCLKLAAQKYTDLAREGKLREDKLREDKLREDKLRGDRAALPLLPDGSLDFGKLSVKELKEALADNGVTDIRGCTEKHELVELFHSSRDAASRPPPAKEISWYTHDQAKEVQAKELQAKEVQRILREKDNYAILGIAQNSDEDVAKKAYRKLALKLHPDKCGAPGADEAFKRISNAFKCLCVQGGEENLASNKENLSEQLSASKPAQPASADTCPDWYKFWQDGPASAFLYRDDGDDVIQIFEGWRGVVSYKADGTVSQISWKQGKLGGQVPEQMSRWSIEPAAPPAATESKIDDIMARFNKLRET